MSSAKSDKFSAARLGSLLEAEIADPLAACYCVALSGGADSVALLGAMAELRSASRTLGLRALHVDHGLHAQSGEWAEQARKTAQTLGIECTVERVQVESASGASVEAAARDARYAVLGAALGPEEILLTAHHVDDQLETVLLQLARGAGVAGLAAMPVLAPLGRGRHLRPLLAVSHSALLQYATERGLAWNDDPMNADLRFDRGFLRASVLPALRKRWPSIAANAARSARHMAEAQGLLDAVAEHDWMRARDGARLEVAGLMGLEPGRAANLVRFWIRRFGHNLPSAQNLERLLAMMTGAASDSTPCVRWPGTAVRRYRGRLYISQAGELAAPGEMEWNWTARRSLALGAGLGSLSMTAGPGPATLAQDRLPKLLSLRAGTGGESLRPSPGARQRSLRNLYQEAGVVPWLRKSIPHLCAGRELIAVGNLWSDARYQPQEGETAIHVEWRDGPELF